MPRLNRSHLTKEQPGASSGLSGSRGFCIVQSTKSASNLFAITATEYGTLQEAYDHFNSVLFGSCLPQVLITLQRKSRARGYFSVNRFRRRDASRQWTHEVALNPDCFPHRSDEDVLSTLVHEMVHVYQQEHGHPGRGRYHNREWAAKMHSIGLMPSSTGEPGGRVTGDRVSHYILKGQSFDIACQGFLRQYQLVWESAVDEITSSSTARPIAAETKQTRTKFTCPNCGLNAWAKPGARIDCHGCSEEAHEVVLMMAGAAVFLMEAAGG